MASRALARTGSAFPTVFDDFFKPWNEWFDNGNFWGNSLNVPAVNVTDNSENYVLTLAAPGLKKDDFKVAIEGNLLTVSSEKEETKEEKEKKYTRKEYNYSSFSRSFSLPNEVNKEKIDASYQDGILKVILPKNETSKKPASTKSIEVK